jgi:hypothetical protein
VELLAGLLGGPQPIETADALLAHFQGLLSDLPRAWRDRLAPHLAMYTRRDLERLFAGLPVRFIERRVVFGAYDNIIARRPRLGNLLRVFLQTLERTPLQTFGLSHFWVIEKN